MLAAIALAGAVASSPHLSASDTQAWRTDLRALTAAIVRYHRAPFHHIAQRAFIARAAVIERRLPSLSRADAVAALMELAAAVGDDHTGLSVGGATPAHFHLLPIKLYRFADGMGVIAATSPNADLAGARVVAVGGVPVAEVERRLARYASASNAWSMRWSLPYLMARPELLHAAGVSGEELAATFTFAQADGARVTRRLLPAPAELLRTMQPYRLDAGAGWSGARPASVAAPLALRNAADNAWFERDERGTLYVQDNAVADGATETALAFFSRVIAAAHETVPLRVVLDLRFNGGGDNTLLDPIVTALAADSIVNRSGRFFVIIGRQTQSAAENFVDRLERRTHARFVGEPTGESPNMYGDPVAFRLPRSGIVANISSLYWQDALPYDPRDATYPEIAAETTLVDYVAGRDAALDAIVAGPPPPLEDAVRAPLAAGDASRVDAAARAWLAAPDHRFADPWQTIEALGGAAADDKRFDAAASLLRVAVERHPERAFAYDDLAEALSRGKRDADARAAYRTALAHDPRDARAAAALGLDVAPPARRAVTSRERSSR